MAESVADKKMKLRYAGACRVCQTDLAAGVSAVYERQSKTVRCMECLPVHSVDDLTHVATTEMSAVPPVQAPESGEAGLSARREYERRVAKREARVRSKHPRLGGLILAVSDDPQSTTAWNTGALGEERLGKGLTDRASSTVRLLHDRRIPGTRANIDHIAVTATGVFVIDAKRYVDKRPALRVDGGLFRPRTEKLLVGGRDVTKLVDGVLKQVEVVRAVVGEIVPVRGILCFIESDWPLIGGDFTTRGVDVLWPKKFYPRLGLDGQHAGAVESLHANLAKALPPA